MRFIEVEPHHFQREVEGMGGGESKPEKPPEEEASCGPRTAQIVSTIAGPAPLERYLGLENYGNTCYCNAVLQLLFHAQALRERLLVVSQAKPSTVDNVLTRMAELFNVLENKRSGKTCYGPKALVAKVKQEKPNFNNNQQQDAHEFSMTLINLLIEEERAMFEVPGGQKSPIQALFEGELAAETVCMDCETKMTSTEPFLDLSLEVEQNVSLVRCMKQFSSSEFMGSEQQVRCDACCCPVAARRSLRLHKAPPLFLVHLKRFKYVEQTRAFKKLSYRIPFSRMIKANFNDEEVTYDIAGFVVHQGSGPNLGHYFCVVVSGKYWLKLDDQTVSVLSDYDVQRYFGVHASTDNVTSTAYMILYAMRKPPDAKATR